MNWDEQKAKLKMKFAFLTKNDSMFLGDKKDEIFKRLQIELGITKEELEKIIEAL